MSEEPALLDATLPPSLDDPSCDPTPPSSNGTENGYHNGNGENGDGGGTSMSLLGDHLSLAGLDLVAVPQELGEKYGGFVKHLDLSYNSIERLDNLGRFVNLVGLVLDNNNFSNENNNIPKIDSLKTLSVNNNQISDLKQFLETVKSKFPNIKYLSMIKNPACPNEFTGRDSDDYQRYRYYVLHTLRGLKFLDSREVNEEEKKEALRIGHLCLPARPDPSQYKRSPTPPEKGNGSEGDAPLPELPQDLKQEGVGKASFGLSNYVYYGRQSEGNRFIVDRDL